MSFPSKRIKSFVQFRASISHENFPFSMTLKYVVHVLTGLIAKIASVIWPEFEIIAPSSNSSKVGLSLVGKPVQRVVIQSEISWKIFLEKKAWLHLQERLVLSWRPPKAAAHLRGKVKRFFQLFLIFIIFFTEETLNSSLFILVLLSFMLVQRLGPVLRTCLRTEHNETFWVNKYSFITGSYGQHSKIQAHSSQCSVFPHKLLTVFNPQACRSVLMRSLAGRRIVRFWRLQKKPLTNKDVLKQIADQKCQP
jgi:hypothetical protein